MAKKSFKEWLEGLQQESWQLEMIVSGLSIALLLNGFDSLREISAESATWQNASPAALLLRFCLFVSPIVFIFLIINLCVHLLCRALWIGTVGLRSVSGDIEYDKLHYNERFTKYLKKRIGSFDTYIERLENFCSLLFSFTFLTVFCIISTLLFFLTVMLTVLFCEKFFGLFFREEIVYNIGQALTIPLLLAGLIYLIDFITLGFFKRRKRYFGWYMPIYRFMSFITFSAIYRPIYHNLLDNKLGRRLGWWLFPYVIVVIIGMSLEVKSHPWFPEKEAWHLTYSKQDYAGTRDYKKYSKTPMLASQFIDSDYLQVFIPYISHRSDGVLERVCPTFKPNKSTGIISDIQLGMQDGINAAERKELNRIIADSSFLCLQKINRIYLDDSLQTEIDFMLKRREKSQTYGLIGVLDISAITPGKHIIRFERLSGNFSSHQHGSEPQDSLFWKEQRTISFWKEK